MQCIQVLGQFLRTTVPALHYVINAFRYLQANWLMIRLLVHSTVSPCAVTDLTHMHAMTHDIIIIVPTHVISLDLIIERRWIT